MSPSRRRVLRAAPAALCAAWVAALALGSVSPLVPGAAAADPTLAPSADPAATPAASPTPDPLVTPAPDPPPTPTATPAPAPTATPAPAPTAAPLPSPTVPPVATPSPAATAAPLPTPGLLDLGPTPEPPSASEIPLYPLIVPASLIDPTTPSPHALDSLVEDGCSVCHRSHAASDGTLLAATYRTDLKTAGQPYQQSDFALCYLCHDPAPFETAGTGGTNFDLHAQHLSELADGTTANAVCAECHYQLHETSAEVGSKLIDFGPSVTANGLGTLEWTGTVGRTCSLSCHGHDHVDAGY